MIKAHRLGRTFEETLQHLNERMPSEEVNLMTTTLLVGRETGGDVTTIIGQMITTIREKRKLTEKISTLTLQGRVQAYIMSALPVGFAALIKTFNPQYFDPLLGTAVGRSLMVLAVALWLVGMVVLLRMCKVEI
jgi:tight adherence protein B